MFCSQKRSIFKSKSANPDSNGGSGDGKKVRSLYKHNWNQDDADKSAKEDLQSQIMDRVLSGKSSTGQGFDFDDDFGDSASSAATSSQEMPFSANKLVKVTNKADNFGFDDDQEVVSVKCPKGAKGYYTVIKNVRKTHQIQASFLS